MSDRRFEVAVGCQILLGDRFVGTAKVTSAYPLPAETLHICPRQDVLALCRGGEVLRSRIHGFDKRDGWMQTGPCYTAHSALRPDVFGRCVRCDADVVIASFDAQDIEMI